MQTLQQLFAEWQQTEEKAIGLWKSTAELIKNSIQRVIDGKNTIDELKEVVQRMYNRTKTMSINAYYERALNDIIELQKTK
jgi:uncharacterized protein YyaL (SSP411 family)